MGRWMKRTAIAIAVVALIAVVLALAAGPLAERKRSRTVDLRVAPVAFVSDEASIRRGKYLYESRGCMECHGANGAGREVVNDGAGMYIRSPNISPGPGSVVKGYGEADWVRAIRHGVSAQKHPLTLMPSRDYSRMTDADLAALVAYVRSLPPASGGAAVIRQPLVVQALYALGAIKDDAEQIDHGLPPPVPVAEAVSVEHGRYVAFMCTGCHGDGFSGGAIPGAPPDWPPAANLTPGSGSAMAGYDQPEKLAAMMRTGKRPDGRPVSAVMPFETLRNLNDTDIGAIYAFLKTLPARPAGGR
jgi:mono/diheme cytochrome c family protein